VDFDAIVLAGGRGLRLGGIDKGALEIEGTTLLERALAAVAGARRTIVVGNRRATSREVLWCREDPPGEGPAEALAEGLRHVQEDIAVVVAVDHPFVERATVSALLGGIGGRDAVLGRDDGGVEQHLVAAYRADPLRHALALKRGRGVWAAALTINHTTIDIGKAGNDVDTPADLEAAREPDS
jgi:molybdopterin-guanine dinucleotide biosynthesis protein A